VAQGCADVEPVMSASGSPSASTFSAVSSSSFRLLRRTASLALICTSITYSVSQKNPPWGFVVFSSNGCEFLLRPNFTCLLRVHIYARVQTFIQLSATLTKLCHIKRDHPVHIMQNVHHRPKRTLLFSDISPKQLGIFSPIFTRLLHVPIYARIQIFIQLSPTVTKLCHIKCDHPACVSVDGGQTF